MTAPAWGWAAFVAFVLAMLALDLLVLHRRAGEVSLKEASIWTAVWVAIGLGFAAVLWAWRGGGTAQAYLAGYLIEKSLSLDNVFVFAVIFSAFAIPARYQHRVLMLGIAGALLMRAAFIVAGVTLLEAFHPVIYLFGAVLLAAAVTMLRGGHHPRPEHNRALKTLTRALPATGHLDGQRFLLRDRGRVLATPLLLALIVIETTDLVFAVDSIPAVLAVTTDPFVVYTSNVFALLGMRALYFLLAGAAIRFRYLQPGLAVILAGVAAKLLLADVYKVPAWASPAFIAVVLAAVAILSIRDNRRATEQPAQGNQDRTDVPQPAESAPGNAGPVPLGDDSHGQIRPTQEPMAAQRRTAAGRHRRELDPASPRCRRPRSFSATGQDVTMRAVPGLRGIGQQPGRDLRPALLAGPEVSRRQPGEGVLDVRQFPAGSDRAVQQRLSLRLSRPVSAAARLTRGRMVGQRQFGDLPQTGPPPGLQ